VRGDLEGASADIQTGEGQGGRGSKKQNAGGERTDHPATARRERISAGCYFCELKARKTEGREKVKSKKKQKSRP